MKCALLDRLNERRRMRIGGYFALRAGDVPQKLTGTRRELSTAFSLSFAHSFALIHSLASHLVHLSLASRDGHHAACCCCSYVCSSALRAQLDRWHPARGLLGPGARLDPAFAQAQARQGAHRHATRCWWLYVSLLSLSPLLLLLFSLLALTARAHGAAAKFTYVEGWQVIEIANHIFGFNGWSSTVIDISPDYVRALSLSRSLALALSSSHHLTSPPALGGERQVRGRRDGRRQGHAQGRHVSRGRGLRHGRGPQEGPGDREGKEAGGHRCAQASAALVRRRPRQLPLLQTARQEDSLGATG